MFLKLIGERDHQIFAPQLELRVDRVRIREIDEVLILRVCESADLLELSLHFEDYLLPLFALHRVEVQVFYADSFVLVLEMGFSGEVDVSLLQVAVRQFAVVAEVVVVPLGQVGGVVLLLEVFKAQRLVS